MAISIRNGDDFNRALLRMQKALPKHISSSWKIYIRQVRQEAQKLVPVEQRLSKSQKKQLRRIYEERPQRPGPPSFPLLSGVRRPGSLRRSLKEIVRRRDDLFIGVIGSSKDYAPFVEFGTLGFSPHPIQVGTPRRPRRSWPAKSVRTAGRQTMPFLRTGLLRVQKRRILPRLIRFAYIQAANEAKGRSV